MSDHRRLTREQRRARHALRLWSDAVDDRIDADYKTLVNGFGAQVLRSGLLAAVAFARRYVNEKASDHMLTGLTTPHVMSVGALQNVEPADLVEAVSGLDSTRYMLATREVLAAIIWLRRSVQGVGDTSPTSEAPS